LRGGLAAAFSEAPMKHLPYVPALAGLLCLALSGPARSAPIDLPDIPQCTELTPGAISTDSTPVTLGLRVVLDGVSASAAAPIVAAALTSYTPLNITLNVSYDAASFSSSNGLELIEEVKQFYGGSRPAGTHLVFVLTSKNLTDGGVVGDALAGQADCIGGVAYADSAFAVGELDADVGAKTMAHELGHLFGGHHHYANCAEALAKGGDNLCTLMINDVGLASLPFSTLNGLMVRGHAQLAAAPAASGRKASTADAAGGLPLMSLLSLLAAGLLRRYTSGAGLRS